MDVHISLKIWKFFFFFLVVLGFELMASAGTLSLELEPLCQPSFLNLIN
jgi:hypothetical protein